MNLIKLAGCKLVPVIDTAGMKRKEVNKLLKDGYKEFFFSEKPESGEGESAVLSFEERGNKIYQKWTVTPDAEYYQEQINGMKAALAASDYKVIKSNEALLIGEELPYDIEELRSERQFLRDEINRLEGLVS